jgi:three-Cys-motif partner protein
MTADRSQGRRELYRDRGQSYVKHVVLRKYLERFAYIIGSWADSITYVDGFSGPWQARSEDFRDTSFAIAIEELRKARQHLWQTRNRRVSLRCFFVETDSTAFEQLKGYCEPIKDVEIQIANSEFEAAISEICRFIKQPTGKKFAFILVDPKGWDGFSMTAMSSLLELPRVEVLVNFMTSFIKRFLESPDALTQHQLEALFGDGSFRKVIEGLSGLDREYAAVEAYASNLAQAGSFQYVCKAIVLNPEIDKTHYHLIYATRDPTGVEVFKQAEFKAMKEMNLIRAEVDQRKREQKTQQTELFDPTTVAGWGHYSELREFFVNKARAEVWDQIRSKKDVVYDRLWANAMRFPVVWDSDLKDWLSQWRKEGRIEVANLKPPERVPKLGANHRIKLK